VEKDRRLFLLGEALQAHYEIVEVHLVAVEVRPVDAERLAPSIPLRRGGQPEEAAQAILWLLSRLSSYTTGSFVEVSGGR
jgi:NAD(P)-dependent dehydrogenase (short-subunit alcohol dehydrogenase family)